MTPFNFPFWLIFKAGIPMLCTGNTILSRTSDSTPQVGELVEKIFLDSGFT
jgi:acyl-CoA reductase-like NAD-dependent aldehyde dehydrogenase